MTNGNLRACYSRAMLFVLRSSPASPSTINAAINASRSLPDHRSFIAVFFRIYGPRRYRLPGTERRRNISRTKSK